MSTDHEESRQRAALRPRSRSARLFYLLSFQHFSAASQVGLQSPRAVPLSKSVVGLGFGRHSLAFPAGRSEQLQDLSIVKIIIMASIPVVVGEQYVTPYDTQLSISRKVSKIHDGDFAITDSEGNTLFHLKEKKISLRDKKVLYDGAESPVLTLHKKALSIHSTFEVSSGESGDNLFSLKKAHSSGDGEGYEAYIQGSSGADFVIKGDFARRDYTIVYNGEYVVAEIGKALFNLSSIFGGGKHKYGVTVKSGVDQAFVAAVVVIIDSIHSEEKGDESSDSD